MTEPTSHNTDLQNADIDTERYNREILINVNGTDVIFKVSFLPMLQAIVYTGMDGTCGEIYLERPFASLTPSDALLTIEINHDIDQKKDQKKIKQKAQQSDEELFEEYVETFEK